MHNAPTDLRRSQNFLKSSRLVDRLLDRSGIGSADLVCEIGPGRGRITARLAPRCRAVIAVEKDMALAARLRWRFAGEPRVAIHAADFLDFPLPAEPYKVFANLPFDQTAAIITKLTSGPRAPDDSFLMMQREATERVLGRPRESLYAVLLKPWFEPSIIHRFAREDFDPAPRVDVVMLRLRKRGPPLIADHLAQPFRDFIAHAFTSWQPSARGIPAALGGGRRLRSSLNDLALPPWSGPTAVRFEQWLALFAAFERDGGVLWHAVAGSESRLRRQQARLQKRHRTAASGSRRARR